MVTPYLVLVPGLEVLAVLADRGLVVFSDFGHSLVQVWRGRSVYGHVDSASDLTSNQKHLLYRSEGKQLD